MARLWLVGFSVLIAVAAHAGGDQPASDAGDPGVPGDPGAASEPVLLTNPPGFFNLAYCSGESPEDTARRLYELNWKRTAANFEVTIVDETRASYRDFIQSVIRRDPSHRIVYRLHSHGIYSRDDRAGVLNLFETNFVHSTDPASLRVIPTEKGLLVDWERDERSFYDEYDTIAQAREFTVNGYAVFRAQGDGPLERVWPQAKEGQDEIPLESPAITQFLDSLVVAGERYRYEVRTIGPMMREYAFSGQLEAVAGESQPVPFVHEHQSVIEGSPFDSTYVGHFRIWSETPDTRAWIRIDANADGLFDDTVETIPMRPSTENWLEAIVTLEASDHSDLDIDVIFGYAYVLEFEAATGERLRLPEKGVYTTSINNRVRDARRGFYLMQMSSPYWIDEVLRVLEFEGARRDGPVGGTLLDELCFVPSEVADAMPVDLTSEDMARGAIDLVRSIHDNRSDLAIYYGVDRMPGDELADSLVAAGADGGMLSGFAVAPWHDAAGEAAGIADPDTWQRQMRAVESAIERGQESLLLAIGPLTDQRARLFALGSYLLVQAPGVRLAYTPDRCQSPPLPEWGVDLGEGEPVAGAFAPSKSQTGESQTGESGTGGSGPGGSGTEPPAVYRRVFQRGFVWVNPFAERSNRIVVDPPGYLLVLDTSDVDGGESGARGGVGEAGVGRVSWKWVDEIEIAPHSAAIVARPFTPTAGGGSE